MNPLFSMACRSSSFAVRDLIDINGSPSSSSNSDDHNSSRTAVNVDHQNELFVGGSSLKLRQGGFQIQPTSTATAAAAMDLFQKRTSTVERSNVISGKAAGGGRGRYRARGDLQMISRDCRDYRFGGSRPPSLLESSFIPVLEKHEGGLGNIAFPTPGEQAETAQMTIFYAGKVNVYDNVPADKADAVMILAKQCSADHPHVQDQTTQLDFTPKTTQSSSGNAHEGIPLARQQSLKRFLEKRRGRMLNNFPYAKNGS